MRKLPKPATPNGVQKDRTERYFVKKKVDNLHRLTTNKYGQGTTVTILPDAWTMSQKMPDLTRDILDYVISLRGSKAFVDIVGANENTDLAVAQSVNGFRVAVINHKSPVSEVVLRPLQTAAGRGFGWVDLVTNQEFPGSGSDFSLKLKVPGNGFRALEFRGLPVP